MQQACEFLVGEHDFRNFCRIDMNKGRLEMNYVRTITYANISFVSYVLTIFNMREQVFKAIWRHFLFHFEKVFVLWDILIFYRKELLIFEIEIFLEIIHYQHQIKTTKLLTMGFCYSPSWEAAFFGIRFVV